VNKRASTKINFCSEVFILKCLKVTLSNRDSVQPAIQWWPFRQKNQLREAQLVGTEGGCCPKKRKGVRRKQHPAVCQVCF